MKESKIKLKTDRRFLKIWFIQIGYINDIIGVCLFDKYCYTNLNGFEILSK